VIDTFNRSVRRAVASSQGAVTSADLKARHSVARWGHLAVEGFNLLDAQVSDVDYYYASRLPGEPADGVNDIHTHPQAPRTIRLRLSAAWPQSGEDLPPQTGHPRVGDEHH
jgi:hypothetical protein